MPLPAARLSHSRPRLPAGRRTAGLARGVRQYRRHRLAIAIAACRQRPCRRQVHCDRVPRRSGNRRRCGLAGCKTVTTSWRGAKTTTRRCSPADRGATAAAVRQRRRRSALHLPSLAIIGSRNPTPEGRTQRPRLCASILQGRASPSSAAWPRASTRPHTAARSTAGGKTVAFLGTGIDRVYPAVNRDLAHAIAEERRAGQRIRARGASRTLAFSRNAIV